LLSPDSIEFAIAFSGFETITFMSSAVIERLSVAARAVLEALPEQMHFQGPTSLALANQVQLLADQVEQVLVAIWSINDGHNG
jgi:hypothetical protein